MARPSREEVLAFVSRVIGSCQTPEQLACAERLAGLAYEAGYIKYQRAWFRFTPVIGSSQ